MRRKEALLPDPDPRWLCACFTKSAQDPDTGLQWHAEQQREDDVEGIEHVWPIESRLHAGSDDEQLRQYAQLFGQH